jgi:serine/threonine protein kinase
MGGRKSKAADVYSFGMLLYEVYTGDMPFSGGLSKEIIYMQVGGASGRRDWDTN